MSLDHLSLDAITETDLLGLINLPEGPQLEFKEKSYEDDEAKGEFRKDVTALANMHGGHIVIGMAEAEGVATAVLPLTGDMGKAIETLESLIRDGIEPRITGIRMHAVPVEGGHVIVVRIPRSWNPPHRISVRGANRFYVRNTNGAHEASVEELRMLFTLSATIQDRVRAFRQERLAKIAAGETPVQLIESSGKLILHIMPFSAFSLHDPVDLKSLEKTYFELTPDESSQSIHRRYNLGGLVVFNEASNSSAYTQLFRNGCIETVWTNVHYPLPNTKEIGISATRATKNIKSSIDRYFPFAQRVAIGAPLVVTLTISGTKGARLIKNNYDYQLSAPPQIRDSTIDLPEIIIERYGTAADHMRALHPAFDALWNAGDAARCPAYDDEGNWIGLRE